MRQALNSAEWLTYGHDYTNQRFAPLDQITKSNVARLTPAYVFQTGIADAFETSPIVSNGIMYLSSAQDHVFAIDARTGEVLWDHAPRLKEHLNICCGPVNRGVALADGLVLIGLVDGRLVALDQYTGDVQWSVQVADNALGYSITAPPLAYKDMVIIGVAGGEFGIRGSITAYALDDGHLVWRWYATDRQHWAGTFAATAPGGIPLDRNLARERATYHDYAQAWRRGGGAIWQVPAADPQRDAIYFATGNPWPDYAGDVRPGDNLFTDSIVSLNASTGRMNWYFQEVPHDVWDFDAASPAMLFDTVDTSGHAVNAVAEAGKTGWFYILNRDTGKVIRISERFVPQPNSFAAVLRTGPLGLNESGGGSNWSPVSYNPQLKIAVTVGISRPIRIHHRQARTPALAHHGVASGIDVDTGKIVWQDYFDEPLQGGTVSTSGGLTFLGESNGYFDALDTKTGAVLWRFQTGAGVNAPPIAFAIDGEEYIAVASGGNQRVHSRYGDSLFVFHLPH